MPTVALSNRLCLHAANQVRYTPATSAPSDRRVFTFEHGHERSFVPKPIRPLPHAQVGESR
jgi:hypothetical protein